MTRGVELRENKNYLVTRVSRCIIDDEEILNIYLYYELSEKIKFTVLRGGAREVWKYVLVQNRNKRQ